MQPRAFIVSSAHNPTLFELKDILRELLKHPAYHNALTPVLDTNRILIVPHSAKVLNKIPHICLNYRLGFYQPVTKEELSSMEPAIVCHQDDYTGLSEFLLTHTGMLLAQRLMGKYVDQQGKSLEHKDLPTHPYAKHFSLTKGSDQERLKVYPELQPFFV